MLDLRTGEPLMLSARDGDDEAFRVLALHLRAAFARLLGLGLDPHFLAATLLGIVAQRLVRIICEGCKIEFELPTDRFAFLRHTGIFDVPRCAFKRTDGDPRASYGGRGSYVGHRHRPLHRDSRRPHT